MEVGFLSACMSDDLADQIIPWMKKHGIKAIELGGAQAAYFKKEFIPDIKDMLKGSDIKITALGNFQNYMDGDEKARKEKFASLKDSIETAELLSIPCITCFTGFNNTKNYDGNVKQFKEEWIPIIEFAKDHGIKIAIENCPARGAYGFGPVGNLMTTPGIFGDLIRITPKNFGLNFDPSHLVWQNVDVELVVEEFSDRIFHTHAKDTQIHEETMKFAGVFGGGIYTFRIPGKGGIYWKSYIAKLKEVGYDGVLSIEMEDPLYSGSSAKAKEGILWSFNYLNDIIKS